MMSSRVGKVETWFEAHPSPEREVAKAVRDVVLAADPRVAVVMKWKVPTFTFCGNIASFLPSAPSRVELMFHDGVILPIRAGLLEGDGPLARTAQFHSIDDLTRKATALQTVVQGWVSLRSFMIR